MKIEFTHFGGIEIDLRTQEYRNCSALALYVGDPETRVSVGSMGAIVTLIEMNLRITIDKQDGDPSEWEDADFARKKVLDELLKQATAQDIYKIFTLFSLSGKVKGEQEAKSEIRKVLGLNS